MKPSLASRSLLLLLSLLSYSFTLQAQVHFRSYSPGRYYDKAGTKHIGFIDFGNNFWGTVKINFREGTDTAANQKIDISDIRALVIMHPPDTAYAPGTLNLAKQMVADSFVVIQENVDFPEPTSTDTR